MPTALSDLIFNIDYSSAFTVADVAACLQLLGFEYTEEDIIVENKRRS